MKPTRLVQAMAQAGVMDARYHRPFVHCSWPTFVGAMVNLHKLRETLK